MAELSKYWAIFLKASKASVYIGCIVISTALKISEIKQSDTDNSQSILEAASLILSIWYSVGLLWEQLNLIDSFKSKLALSHDIIEGQIHCDNNGNIVNHNAAQQQHIQDINAVANMFNINLWGAAGIIPPNNPPDNSNTNLKRFTLGAIAAISIIGCVTTNEVFKLKLFESGWTNFGIIVLLGLSHILSTYNTWSSASTYSGNYGTISRYNEAFVMNTDRINTALGAANQQQPAQQLNRDIQFFKDNFHEITELKYELNSVNDPITGVINGVGSLVVGAAGIYYSIK